MDWRDEVVDAQAFVETLKSDVFQEMLYVFTPAGDIIELPAGSTPVDFAYRIHSDVGHTCVGAMVNDRLVPLDYKLQNGEMVKIMTSRAKVGPSRDWLMASSGYVHTAQAREKIRQWFRRQQRDQNIAQGRDMLEKELKRLGVEIKLEEIAKQFARYNRLDDFLAAIGYGAVSTQQIAQQVSALNPVEPAIALPPTEAAPRPATASSGDRGDGRRRSPHAAGDLLQAGAGGRDHRLRDARQGHHRPSHRLPECHQGAGAGTARARLVGATRTRSPTPSACGWRRGIASG